MAISEQQRQKKLLKKKQKKATAVKVVKSFTSMSVSANAANCAEYPIYECWIPSGLFIEGIGEVFVARKLPNARIAVSVFLLDVFCLGVKNAFFKVMVDKDYEDMIDEVTGGHRGFESIDPSCARSLVEGAAGYAKNLGINCHADYKEAAKLFGKLDAGACPVHYEYGKEGKPFYVRGPYESDMESKKIVDKLHEKCGEGGYKFVFMLGHEHFDV
jgi:hypothetical protein